MFTTNTVYIHFSNTYFHTSRFFYILDLNDSMNDYEPIRWINNL